MNPNIVAGIIEGFIPLSLGVYFTLVGHRLLGKKAGKDYRYDQWHEKFCPMMKVLGPIVALFGVFMILRNLFLGG
jgi:hypothetical protein